MNDSFLGQDQVHRWTHGRGERGESGGGSLVPRAKVSQMEKQEEQETYEYRTKLGMTKVVLRWSWGYHHCKTDRGPP